MTVRRAVAHVPLIAFLLLAFAAAFLCEDRLNSQTVITLNDAANSGCIITATNPCPRAGINLGQASGAFPQFRNLLQFLK